MYHFFLLLLILPLNTVSEANAYDAMVMDVKGKVSVVHKGTNKPVDLGALLDSGDTVKIAKDASITLNYSKSGLEEQWPGGLNFTVGKTQSHPSDPRVKKKTRKIILVQTDDSIGPGGRFVMKGGGPPSIAVKGLSGTCTLEERPTFCWDSISHADQYRISLFYESQVKPLWEQSTTETEIRYPKSAPSLSDGNHYEWLVEALQNGRVIAEKTSCFHLPKKEESIKIKEQIKLFLDQLRINPKDIPTRLAYTLFLENHLLYDEAIVQYKTILELSGESKSIVDREKALLQIRLSGCD